MHGFPPDSVHIRSIRRVYCLTTIVRSTHTNRHNEGRTLRNRGSASLLPVGVPPAGGRTRFLPHSAALWQATDIGRVM